MNAPLAATGTSSSRSGARVDDEINLLELLDVVVDHRRLIACVTALFLILGCAYALLASPVYRADTLIQVEDTTGDPLGGLLGQAASGLFDIRSQATAEMQILRSRLVVDQAVSNLGLDIDVQPRYLPLVGRWLAGRATQPSKPGILGWGGFVSGNERLAVGSFEVPDALQGRQFDVVLRGEGDYRLISPDGVELGQGRVGQPLHFDTDKGAGLLLVTEAYGLVGARFGVTRQFRLQVTESLQHALRISEEGKQSGVIRASLEGDDPLQVARLLNEVGALYVRQNTERKAAEAEKTLTFLGTFLPQLRKQLEMSESKYNQFRNQNSTFDLNSEGRAVLGKSVELETQLLSLQQERKELRALYTAEHHTVRAVDAQIAGVEDRLADVNRRVKTLPTMEQTLLSLMRDVKVNSEMYANLLNSAQQLRLLKEGKVGNVRVVDVAVAARNAVKPAKVLVIALSAMIGILAGIGVAFLRNALRSGLKDPAAIEEAGLHVFATVPHSELQARQAQDIRKGNGTRRVLAIESPQEPAVESLRSLRTTLQFALLDAPSNVLLITGPTPGIGKSFVSVNLATVLGAASKRVLLIDGDLRVGHLNQYLGLPRERGFSEVVSGSLPLEQAIHSQAVPGVDFMSTGVLPPNPAELLMSAAAADLLRQVSDRYDVVLIDAPPVLVASDAAILASLAGALFMVARAEVTSMGELQEANKRLQDVGAKSKGVIFNDLRTNKRRYGYGLGYKYGAYRYTN